MNSSRQRRRLRRGMEDWGNLYQHALNADTSPEFVALMEQEGWVWQQLEELDAQVTGRGAHRTPLT